MENWKQSIDKNFKNNTVLNFILGVVSGFIAFYSIKLFKLQSIYIIVTIIHLYLLSLTNIPKKWLNLSVAVIYLGFILFLPNANFYSFFGSFIIYLIYLAMLFIKNIIYRLLFLIFCFIIIYFNFGMFFLTAINFNRIIDGSIFY